MLNLLKSRRSIRKFKAHKIEKEKIKRILQCALIAPSGRGLKPWEFVVVITSYSIHYTKLYDHINS